MDLIISNSSGKPIYEQITAQIKNLIMTEVLKNGEVLPSMRLLAKELRISVITTKRAYEELERDGFIESVPGKGSFVKEKNLDFLRETRLQQVEEYLQKAADAAKNCDISKQEFLEMVTLMYEDTE